MELSEQERLMMSAFGIGHEKAEEVCKHIGLGLPKTAFALGFQAAFKALQDKKFIHLIELETFVREYEKERDNGKKVQHEDNG